MKVLEFKTDCVYVRAMLMSKYYADIKVLTTSAEFWIGKLVRDDANEEIGTIIDACVTDDGVEGLLEIKKGKCPASLLEDHKLSVTAVAAKLEKIFSQPATPGHRSGCYCEICQTERAGGNEC